MIIEINNKIIKNFLSASLNRSVENLVGSFMADATFDIFGNIPFDYGDEIKVRIGSEYVFTGWIDSINVSYDSSGKQLSIASKSKAVDLAQSSLNGIVLRPPITIKQVFEIVLDKIGLDIKVIDSTGLPPLTKADMVVQESGQSLWQFLSKFCVKRQVMAYSNGYGDIILTKQNIDREIGLGTIFHFNGVNPFNNILSASYSKTNENRFYKYIVSGQARPIFSGSEPLQLIDQSGNAVDSEVRKSRIKTVQSSSSGKKGDAVNEAKWLANIDRYRGFSYSCKVQGFHTNQKKETLLDINKKIMVVDESIGWKNTLLFIKELTYNWGDSSTTDLILTYPDAMTLNSSYDKMKARYNKI